MQKVKLFVLIGVALLAMVLLCVACAPVNSGAKDVAARYDGGEIAESEVSAYTASFRDRNGLEDDKDWAEYLNSEGLTAKTWRERAIGALAEEVLIAKKADELGIKPDEERIQSQIETDLSSFGIDANREGALEAYLDTTGQTEEEYRSRLESASIEQQVLSQNVKLDPIDDVAVLDEYIQKQLAPRVVRRYRVLCFDAREKAQTAIDDMAGLSGDELVVRFDGWLDRDDSDTTTSAGHGDMGWDIASNLGDVQYELNTEMLPVGAVSSSPHEIDGMYYVFYCVNRFEFGTSTTYGSLPDDELKQYVASVATYANWSKLTANYIAELCDAANIQVSPMPKGLPYDLG